MTTAPHRLPSAVPLTGGSTPDDSTPDDSVAAMRDAATSSSAAYPQGSGAVPASGEEASAQMPSGQAGEAGGQGTARDLPTSPPAAPSGESGVRSAPGETDTLQVLAGKVDEAARRVAELDGAARQAAEELRRAVEAVHRAGLATIVRRMRADDRARELLFELVDEPEVRMLLMLHGIIRPDPATEATRVLAAIRPWMRSQDGDAELVRVENGVAYIRLEGASRSCSSPAPDLGERVATVLIERVSAISRVEVVPAEPAPTFIPLTAIGRGPGAGTDTSGAGTGWATR